MWRTKSLPVRRLEPASTIGVFSPSEPIVSSRIDRFNAGLSMLQRYGFHTKLSENCLAHSYYMAGSIESRVSDFHQLIGDPEVDALMASWGGKSCNQLIRSLDYREIRNAQKPIAGFSDAAVILNAITAKTELVTFYGPNIVGKLDETSHADLDLLIHPAEKGNNLLGQSAPSVAKTICGGKVTGRLLGGNLSTFVLGLMCFDWPRNFWDDRIFFWEEGSMPPQLIDQYLTALTNSGLLQRLGGMIVGNFVFDDPVDWKREDGLNSLRRILGDYKFPILYCPTFGHAPLENPILPIGALCDLDAEEGTLKLAEEILK
jgi:muramoyltetrapeptide carboxypeptidase